MTLAEAVSARHSVRKYIDHPLNQRVIDVLHKEISRINSEAGLHFQLVVNERKAFTGFMAYGKFSGVSNYIIIAGKRSEALEYKAGYYGEQLVLLAQQLGLNTCWAGVSYRKVSGTYTLEAGEKILCYIALGYGENQGVKHKSKRPDQVSNISADTPEWFARGVEAALLAPTAVNQQKFRFDYVAPAENRNLAQVIPGKEFSVVGYTKIDLGIAMLHFEIGAGKENFIWKNSPFLDTKYSSCFAT